ncbi:MAG: permease-like cell division protein FtsX [Patescibacteria group bacterium]
MLLSPEYGILFKRGLRRGILNIVRDRGLGASLAAFVAAAALIQFLFLLFIGAESLERMLRAQTDLRLEILSGATNQEIQQFYGGIRELPYVDEAQYVTREQAYELERRRDPELVAFLEEYNLENPFPDTIAVTLRSLDDYDAFAAFIRQEQWKSVVDPTFLSQVTDQEQQVYEMLRFTEAGRSLVLFFLLLVAGVAFFLLIELVRRRALERREEILIERLVGASPLSSILPFAVEASALMSAALLLSVLLIVFLLLSLPALVPAFSVGGPFAALKNAVFSSLRVSGPVITLLEFLVIPVIGFTGAWIGLSHERTTYGFPLTSSPFP